MGLFVIERRDLSVSNLGLTLPKAAPRSPSCKGSSKLLKEVLPLDIGISAVSCHRPDELAQRVS